ncbi:predicted protein [Nematostella vectensis]|uniref:Uncharacterized protein n=1 Tax=Nematostella vectensis TaxID=45351 RepID=A7SNK8_NEMVE|nr:predicted protein [Nematostella vectensis]|eukprot:XP_001626773.1 predicted protein [Nematostella vectensis]
MSCSKDELELRELREWLTYEVHLDRYFDKLTEHGFCSLRLIKDLSEEDLDDLNIRPPYHRKRLLKFCSELGEQDNVAATSATESVETGSEKAIASPAESAPEIDNKPCADGTQDENLETSSSLVNECRDSKFGPPPLPPKVKQKKGNGEVARERPSVPDRESSLKREQNQIESTNTDAGITSDSGTKLQQPSVLSEVDNVVSVEPGLPQLPRPRTNSSNKKKSAPPLPKHVVSPVKRPNKVKAPPPIPPRSDLEVNSQDVPKVASESIESKESDSNVIVNDQFEEIVSGVSNVETSCTSTPSPPQGEVVENETRSGSPKSSRPLARSRPARPPRKHIEKRRESGNSETEEIETSEGISSENDGVAERVTTGVIGDSASVKEEAVFPRNGEEKPEETEEEGSIYGNVSTTSKPLAPPEEKEEECSIYGNISTTSTPVAPPPTPPTRGGSTKRPLPTPRPKPPVTLRNKSVPGPNQKQPAQPYRHSMVSERFAGNPFLSNLEKQLDAASDIKKSRSLDRPANFAQGVHDITNSSESSSKEECRVEEPPSKAPLARLESASDLMLPKRGDGNLKTTNTADGNNYAEAHHSYKRLIEKPIASKADLVTDSTYDLMGGTGVTNPVPVDDNYSQVYDQVDIQNSTSEAGTYESIEAIKPASPVYDRVDHPRLERKSGRRGAHPSKLFSVVGPGLGGKSRESQAINNEMLKKISAMVGGRAGEELFDYESDESADDLVDEVPERKPRGDSTDSLGTSPAQAAAGPRNLRSTSGYLYKQGGRQNNKGWKKRWFVFDGTSLKYYTNKDSQESLHIIPVTQMKDVLVEPGETRKARFNLITGNRVFMLASDTMTDMNLWAQTLMAAILQYKADDSVKKPGGTMSDPDKEGWLKKQGHNMMGDWKRRYVAIKGGSICYYDTYDDFQFETPIHSIEAQLASVKQDPNHRNRFNIITSQKTFSFQVENDFEVSSWIEAVQRAIQIGLSDPAVLEYVFTNPSNRKCADCGNKDPYPHASVNHLVCICGNCCGSHRSLGSNISKPRSLLMDKKIWNDDLKELMVKIGNENANKLLEFKIPDDDRIRPDADSAKRREFICAKYEYKKYSKILPEYGNVDVLGQALRESVQTDDVMRTFELIINRVNVKYVPTDSEDQRTPLELAVAAGKNLQAELLRQNGADSESDDTFTPIVDITEPPSFEVVSSPPVDTFERSGYLYRKEGAMKKRWFTFKDRQLKYYRGCGDKEPMGVIDLANVTSLTMNTNEGTLLLEIVTFDKTHILKGETDEELEAWFTALRNKQVFKVHISLQELGSDGIPHIVANCLQFIETYGVCGHDKRYPKAETVYLTHCDRKVSAYTRSVGIGDISGLFAKPPNVSEMTTALDIVQGLELGGGEGLADVEFQMVWQSILASEWQIVASVSASLRQFCNTQGCLFQLVLDTVPQSTPSVTPGRSLYQPSDSSGDEEVVVKNTKPALAALNCYLQPRDVSPVRSQLKTPWENRTITLSSKATIKVPNVIRTVIPERILQQYLAYCKESGFSRSTCLRVLSVCTASTRKSLQGLDYVSSTGAEAFEELAEVTEKLGDAGLDENSILVSPDWAMKYLPRKYRESQTDWFGKRGIPRRINVAVRRVEAPTVTSAFKIDGVSSISNIENSTEGFRVWRAYDVGPGSLVYANQLEGQGATSVPVLEMPSAQTERVKLIMGWALKETQVKRKRFTDAQRKYLTSKFMLGEATGQKSDPASVARSMMIAKDSNGRRLFDFADFLTANQIAGFFSRLASKKTLDDEVDEVSAIDVARHEAHLEQLTEEVTRAIGIVHPLVYDAYNICELASKKKLNTLAVPLLKSMWSSQGIPVDDFKARRKQPYVDRLQALWNSCTCSNE